MEYLLFLLLLPAVVLFIIIRATTLVKEKVVISCKSASWLNKEQIQLSDGYSIFTEYKFFEDSDYIVIGVHGMGCSTEEFQYLKIFLEKHKISFFFFDQRNYGKNKPFKYKKLPIVVEDIQEIVNLLCSQHGKDKKIVLIGESLGCAISSLCLKYIKPLYKVVLVNFVTNFAVTAVVKTKREAFNFNFKLFLAIMFNKRINLPTWSWSKWLVSDNKDLLQQYYNSLEEQNKYTYNFIYMLHVLIFFKKIPKLLIDNKTIPVLILQSKCDIYLNLKIFEAEKNKIMEQNKIIEFHMLEDQKHMLLSEPKKEEVFKIILNWLIKIK